MRVNVYTEELLTDDDGLPMVDIVKAEYISSRTGEKMANHGLRIYLRSAPQLHFVPPRDDDRSAITFWCGSKEKNITAFIEMIRSRFEERTLETWRERVTADVVAAEKAEAARNESRPILKD
jgi:hypothetical protein